MIFSQVTFHGIKMKSGIYDVICIQRSKEQPRPSTHLCCQIKHQIDKDLLEPFKSFLHPSLSSLWESNTYLGGIVEKTMQISMQREIENLYAKHLNQRGEPGATSCPCTEMSLRCSV